MTKWTNAASGHCPFGRDDVRVNAHQTCTVLTVQSTLDRALIWKCAEHRSQDRRPAWCVGCAMARQSTKSCMRVALPRRRVRRMSPLVTSLCYLDSYLATVSGYCSEEYLHYLLHPLGDDMPGLYHFEVYARCHSSIATKTNKKTIDYEYNAPTARATYVAPSLQKAHTANFSCSGQLYNYTPVVGKLYLEQRQLQCSSPCDAQHTCHWLNRCVRVSMLMIRWVRPIDLHRRGQVNDYDSILSAIVVFSSK